QFFTPFPVCLCMAKIVLSDAKHLVEEQGFIRVQEPCVGSGAMIIALAQAFKDEHRHYQREMHVTAIDIDRTAIHMAYLQLFLLHIPAVVMRGDTLRGDVYEEWWTAAHVIDLWNWKLLRAGMEKEARAATPVEAATDLEPEGATAPVDAPHAPEV